MISPCRWIHSQPRCTAAESARRTREATTSLRDMRKRYRQYGPAQPPTSPDGANPQGRPGGTDGESGGPDRLGLRPLGCGLKELVDLAHILHDVPAGGQRACDPHQDERPEGADRDVAEAVARARRLDPAGDVCEIRADPRRQVRLEVPGRGLEAWSGPASGLDHPRGG